MVVLGWLPFILPSLDNLSAIRSLRALRPLRSISVLPGVRRQATTLLDSLPKMSNVMVLFFFCLSLYAVTGVQLFKGQLLHRCYDSAALASANTSSWTNLRPPSLLPIDADAGVCTLDAPADGLVFLFWGTARCDAPGEACAFYGINPSGGSVSFDNIGYALMTVFQCVTLEGWVDVMCALHDPPLQLPRPHHTALRA